MSERYVTQGAAAVGTNKTLINLFNPAVAPTMRARIFQIVVGSAATPANQASDFVVGRTTALGTEGSGYVPNNLDPAGPAGAYDSGVAHSIEPTYTASKELLAFPVNQQATYTWHAHGEGGELVLAAVQNNGAGLKTTTATGLASHRGCIFFKE